MPERVVRSALHRLGYRFRLHSRKLPGRPDIVLPRHRLAVFVHGCFWHRHRGCRNCTTPTNNRRFWVAKLEGNAARDRMHMRTLRKLGWRVVVVWECETEKKGFAQQLKRRIAKSTGNRPPLGKGQGVAQRSGLRQVSPGRRSQTSQPGHESS